jgi:3'-phosphoadenosine 5'-phosphosulfate synthase
MSFTIKLHITNYLNLKTSTTYTTTKYNKTKIGTKPIYHSNPLISTSYNKPTRTMHVPSYSSSFTLIKSSLIDPDGGSLVDLVVPERERVKKLSEAEALPKVRLTKIDIEWVQVICEGWASPLRGFMRESEYLQSLHFNCLRMEDGSLVNMSLPIVLAIDDDTKTRIGSSPNVGLVGPNGDLVGILRRLVVFEFG